MAESPGLLAAPASEEISVRRINIMDEKGNLAVVIAASPHLPGVIRNGREQGSRQGIPGLIFYNNDGDEIGGLIFPTSAHEDGRRDGGVSLSFDQADHGQAINLIHWTNSDYVRSAFKISDFPTDISSKQIADSPAARKALSALRAATTDEEAERLYGEYLRVMGEERFYAERVYLGSEGRERRKAMLELKDSRSRPRIRLIVDENDKPRIEILDELGAVVWYIDGAHDAKVREEDPSSH